MTNELINFTIPASFILKRVFPTGAEIAFGYERGWLRRKDVVDIALAKYRASQPLHEAERRLSLLLP
jgi:hypothetical protein